MPGRPFVKKKLREIFKLDEIKVRSEYMDAGEMEVVCSYLEIPEGSVYTYKSQKYTFGCLPWHLELHRHYRSGILGDGKAKQVIKVALVCSFSDPAEWTAKVTGTLTMKKWREKLPKCSNSQNLDEHKEIFSRKFTTSCNTLHFCKEFPLPLASDGTAGVGGAFGAAADTSAYVKNKRVKFKLEFILHNVRKSFFPILDFNKPSASSNAVVKVGNDGKHKYHVNKEVCQFGQQFLFK
uniref:Uncharacterized protein n=1 Tax=Globodera rostochiensis TaxID=31243 RepID=A0A914H866_GLORO